MSRMSVSQVLARANAAMVAADLDVTGALASLLAGAVEALPAGAAAVLVESDGALEVLAATSHRATDVEVYQVHLGGHLGAEAALGRKFRGLKVEADRAADYVERVLRGYLDRREPAESFAAYAARADEGWLS